MGDGQAGCQFVKVGGLCVHPIFEFEMSLNMFQVKNMYFYSAVVKCLPPAGIVNGTFSPMNEFYQYRDVVRYSCNNNDLVLNGSRELVCLENEKFSPAPPVCVCKYYALVSNL